MKSKRRLADAAIVAVLTLLLGCLGVIAAWQLVVVGTSARPWTRHVLPAPPAEAVEISRVAVDSYLDDLTGDTIYIHALDYVYYSNTLYDDKWQSVDHPVYSQGPLGEDCAPDWPGAQSKSPIWKAPPVEKKVRDSAGFRFEPPMAIFVRCYVLYDDGSLEVWSRYDDASGIHAFLVFYGPALGVCGELLGVGMGVAIVLVRRRWKRRAALPAQEQGSR